MKARSASDKMIKAIRLTSQLTPKNKVGFYYKYQANCTGWALVNTGDRCRERGDYWIALGNPTTSPESGNMWPKREKITQATWSSSVMTRTNIAIDFYNLFNSNTGTAYNQTYDPVTNGATWLAPSTALNPRFARFNVPVDF